MKKINVWMVGHKTYEGRYNRDKKDIECREMGYVLVADDCERWWDEAWDLLNWSCYRETKPCEVHSPITYCSSDVIFQEEGVEKYMAAKSFGWGKHKSLKLAIRAIRSGKQHFVGSFEK